VLEADARCQVGTVREHHLADRRPAPALVRHPVTAQLAAGFAEEGAPVVPEGIQIQVEPQLADRVIRRVRPGEALTTGDRLVLRIEPHVDRVVHHALGVGRQQVCRRRLGKRNDDEQQDQRATHGHFRRGDERRRILCESRVRLQ
jgi:hypothetical protein